MHSVVVSVVAAVVVAVVGVVVAARARFYSLYNLIQSERGNRRTFLCLPS